MAWEYMESRSAGWGRGWRVLAMAGGGGAGRV